jgi:hypothetical protein
MNTTIFVTTSLLEIAIVLFARTVRKYLQKKSHGILTDRIFKIVRKGGVSITWGGGGGAYI